MEDHYRIVDLHINAVMSLCHAALPSMIEEGKGTIINVASAAAFLNFPGTATYCATKSFLIAFSQSLQNEVRSKGVKVQALCPGFTRTDIAEDLFPGFSYHDQKGATWMEPEDVVAAYLAALNSNRTVCVPGAINKLGIGLATRSPFLNRQLRERLWLGKLKGEYEKGNPRPWERAK